MNFNGNLQTQLALAEYMLLFTWYFILEENDNKKNYQRSSSSMILSRIQAF